MDEEMNRDKNGEADGMNQGRMRSRYCEEVEER